VIVPTLLRAALLLAAFLCVAIFPLKPATPMPPYSIQALRYATIPGFPVSGLVMGAPQNEKLDIAMVIWLIRGGGHNILFDSGFHREKWFKEFTVADFLRPDELVKSAGVQAAEITDIVISHAHWDHLGGIDLFPKATIWIQKDEFRYYTGEAWQPGGDHGGIDPEDVEQLVRLNTQGRLHLVNGDDQEILPGVRAFTGARHTYASQYLRVDASDGKPFVLASDNCYLYRNLTDHAASATFTDADHPANIAAQARMIKLAGSAERVIPGHDLAQFQRYPTQGRIALIR
jgi:glyoxylase-like metal-dependent hydrolase (beta-lactamase superfamily II)